MTPEVFRLAMPGHTVVMVVAADGSRLDAIGRAVQSLRGLAVESHIFAIKGDAATPRTLRDALGELEKDERIYLITAVEGALEYRVLACPKTEGGITVG